MPATWDFEIGICSLNYFCLHWSSAARSRDGYMQLTDHVGMREVSEAAKYLPFYLASDHRKRRESLETERCFIFLLSFWSRENEGSALSHQMSCYVHFIARSVGVSLTPYCPFSSGSCLTIYLLYQVCSEQLVTLKSFQVLTFHPYIFFGEVLLNISFFN